MRFADSQLYICTRTFSASRDIYAKVSNSPPSTSSPKAMSSFRQLPSCCQCYPEILLIDIAPWPRKEVHHKTISILKQKNILSYYYTVDRTPPQHTQAHTARPHTLLYGHSPEERYTDIWGLWCQKQVSQARIRNYITKFLWEVIIYPCLRYLLLVLNSSYGQMDVGIACIIMSAKCKNGNIAWHNMLQYTRRMFFM